MKKLNNKGMTLIELLVSVVLISVIMIFMYKLISDVRNEKKENDKITDNSLKMSEIVVNSMNRIFEGLYKKEVDTIELWNDVWYSESGTDKYITAHFIRLDIVASDGDDYNYAISIYDPDGTETTKPLLMEIKEHQESSGWVLLESWGLSKDIYNVNIKEDCHFDKTINSGVYTNTDLKSLVCSIELELLDQNGKNIETIEYPFHVMTKNFTTDNFNGNFLVRYCEEVAGTPSNNCTHCIKGFSPTQTYPTKRVVSNTYAYRQNYRTKLEDDELFELIGSFSSNMNQYCSIAPTHIIH